MVDSDTAVWDVFVAYASPDRARAQALYEDLVAVGLRVCFDQASLQPGDNWYELLPQWIAGAAVTLLLISSNTEKAHFQQSEIIRAIEQARRRERRIVPVRLEKDIDLPYGTEQFQALDLFIDSDVTAVAGRIATVLRYPSRSVASTPTARPGQVFCDRVPAPPRFFTGRDMLLEHLDEALGRGTTSVLTQTIQGLGGVGKTSVAAALVEAHRHDLQVIWWVRAEEPTILVADLAELADHIGIATRDDMTLTARAVRHWLESTDRPWLVVFDNALDEASIADWLPRRGSGTVIVTSRNRNFGRIGDVIPIDTFPADTAEHFLRYRVKKTNPAAAEGDVSAVVERLAGLPLALEQAAAWVERVPSRTFAGFAELFDAITDPFPESTRPLGYEHTASTGWRVSLSAASNEASLAEPLMAALAFFAPNNLPCQWLREQGHDPYLDAAGELAVDDALAALHGYSLIQIEHTDTVSCHRVVQAIARRASGSAAAAFAARTLRRQTTGKPQDHIHWPRLAILAPHVLTVCQADNARLSACAEDLWWVLDEVAHYQRSSGAVQAAITTATVARQLAETNLGLDHPTSLASQGTLGAAYEAAGDFEQAIPLLQGSVVGRERLLGSDHPWTLHGRNDLAYVYQSAGYFRQAVSLHEATLADRERVLGSDHPDTLTSRNNLAAAYQADGDLQRAIALLEATLADCERILGSDHPDTLTSRNNLAAAYQADGDLQRAIALHEVTLADAERIFGPDHPDTIACRDNLAAACYIVGDVQRSIPLHEAALADAERVFGIDHPKSLTSRNNLANTLVKARDFQRAIPLLEVTLADRERILGSDHPDTLQSRNNLGGAHHIAGDFQRAVALYEAVLSDSERVRGPDHPDTLLIRNNIAHAHQSAGDIQRAIVIYEVVLAHSERVLGSDHFATRVIRHNMKRAHNVQPRPADG